MESGKLASMAEMNASALSAILTTLDNRRAEGTGVLTTALPAAR
jgi:hypothetical protein